MFLVSMFHSMDTSHRLRRKAFHSLCDAEEYCDYYHHKGWTILQLELCDYSLSPLLETCGE